MEKTFDYSYLPCQFCVGKNHCTECGENIRQSLMALEDVVSVEVDAPSRRLRVVSSDGDFDDILDRAEAMGVFL